jgi:hypothetical protein
VSCSLSDFRDAVDRSAPEPLCPQPNRYYHCTVSALPTHARLRRNNKLSDVFLLACMQPLLQSSVNITRASKLGTLKSNGDYDKMARLKLTAVGDIVRVGCLLGKREE